MDAAGLLADEVGLEEHPGIAETIAAHGDDVAGQKLIHLLLGRTLRDSLHLRVEVESTVAEPFLDVAHGLALRCGHEGGATFNRIFLE